MNRVHHLVEEFSDQNLLLQMLLGIFAETGRLEELLTRSAAPKVASSATPQVDDAFTAALLGIVSVRRRLRGLIEQDRGRGRVDRAPARSPSVAARRTRPIRGLMR